MALFWGGDSLFLSPTGSPGFFSAIGKWKCTKSNPPILNTRGKLPPMIPWRENIGKKCTPKILKLKNSPTPKISWLFAWPFQPLQTTDENPPNYTKAPKPPWVPHPFSPAASGHEKTPTGGITGCHRQFPKKKWQNGCMANSICLLCVVFVIEKKELQQQWHWLK